MSRKPCFAILLLGAAVSLASSACGDGGSSSTSATSAGGGGAGAGTSSGGSGGAGATGGTGGTGGSGGTTTGTSTTATNTGGSGGSGGFSCGPLGDACTVCLAAQCTEAYCACYDEPACSAVVKCTQGCPAGDDACNQGCLTANEAGISVAALLSDCAASKCPECPGSATLDPCQKCLFTSCPAQLSKCLANPDCSAIVTCLGGCGDGDTFCQTGCYFQYPDGQQDVDAVSACVMNSCSGQCG